MTDGPSDKIRVYIASPYTSEDEDVVRDRFVYATGVAATLTKAGYVVYSPITHGYPMEKLWGLQGDWVFWKSIDMEFLAWANVLLVICSSGWRESVGVQEEIKVMQVLSRSVWYLNPETKEITTTPPDGDFMGGAPSVTIH